MPHPEEVRLGPLTLTVSNVAGWQMKFGYQLSQPYADEFELLFSFLKEQGQFTRFLPRLKGRERECKGALAKARTAFFLHRKGFQISKWEPIAVSGHPGDLEIQWRDTVIFIEVKGPDWQGQLSKEEIKEGRQKLGKFPKIEGHCVDPPEHVLYAIEKFLPKFSPDRINLVVVVPDLFTSVIRFPIDILMVRISGDLGRLAELNLSGVLILEPEIHAQCVQYRSFFVPNPEAEFPLPPHVHAVFPAGDFDSQESQRRPN